MAEETSFGVARLRQAITNQATCGGQFELSIDSADKLCREIEDQLALLAWAQGVPAPVDAGGAPVPLTTKVMYGNGGGELEIIFFKFNVHNPATHWSAFCENKDGNRGYSVVSNIHLRRPDTWEKLEEDAKLAPRAYMEKRGMNPEKTERVASMMADLVSRAKALAERDAKEA